MESCHNTERDIDKLLAKFESYKSQYDSNLTQLEDQIGKLKEEINQLPADHVIDKHHQAVLGQYNKKIKNCGQKLSGQHKDLHSSVSRIGKTIDRNFDADCSSVIPGSFCHNAKQEKLLNTAVCEHYFRQGQLSLAEDISEEARLDIDDSWKQPFVQINEVLQSLRNHDLDLALEWTAKNHHELQQKGSSLEFMLHRMQFINIMRKGPHAQTEALRYSRKFQAFADGHSKEIQMLMGSFLYMKHGLANSPYSSLLDEQNWDEICDMFMRDSCSILGLSLDSPLLASFTAGCTALPALIAIKSVIEQRQCSGVLTDKDELPIDIDLAHDQHYHSIFACPILRQQTTENNPPMRLTCGHIISRDALNKLIAGSKVKCPYCPMIQSPVDAKRVYF
ncbi:E3 ubiquitin-protein ligase RMND5A-like [Styela clava]|uniref:E3 ubiquitin-protein ligase RMND5A-like n=1 Tax=Styela clava TaxID=7725 RepID=UPI00193A2CA5|nr:E3 ubiquitin-protein ligase RMND5A-like [Styela clava]